MSNYIADKKYNGTLHRAIALIIDRALPTDGVDKTVNSIIHAIEDEHLVPTPIEQVRVGDVLSDHGNRFTVLSISCDTGPQPDCYMLRSKENPDASWYVNAYATVNRMNPVSGITQHQAEALLHAVREMSGNETVTHPDGTSYELDEIALPYGTLRLSEEYSAVIEGSSVVITGSPDAALTGCVFHIDKVKELVDMIDQ